jgi:RimJ/RimL family protein N-acetyltransferase
MAFRGTGSIYHEPGNGDVLNALAGAVMDRASAGSLSLLSGHASQIEPLLPLIADVGVGYTDRCCFRTLQPENLALLLALSQFSPPRPAEGGDMEKLIDFYEIGFYSLANLPTRTAWRNRLSEQLALRTLFIVENGQGEVVSAALSSAEGGTRAMLGGVATRERYRGLGLSALCVGALCDHLFKKGTTGVSLFYLEDNEPAGRVYDKLGFDHEGEWLLVPLGLGASFGPLLGLRSR